MRAHERCMYNVLTIHRPRSIYPRAQKNVLNPIVHRSISGQSLRNRLSDYWTPTASKESTAASAPSEPQHDSTALLVRAGLLRQAHSGIFHLLPLGLRVQNKIEALIDKHMRTLGASKVSLSSVTSEVLWRKTGRLGDERGRSEIFRLSDGRGPNRKTGLMLSPTHEEEITQLVGETITSHRELPLRLYQTSRKYRNELRPRQGLLRAKEFLMKDLYTFDLNRNYAMKTYDEVRQAYANFFEELKIPFITAEADSGNMGGNLSHEYHYASEAGEDKVVSCSSCGYCANEEKAVTDLPLTQELFDAQPKASLHVTDDFKDLVIALLPSLSGETRSLDLNALRSAVPNLCDNSTVEPFTALNAYTPNPKDDPSLSTRRVHLIPDARIPPSSIPQTLKEAMTVGDIPNETYQHLDLSFHHSTTTSEDSPTNTPNNLHILTPIQPNDPCPHCPTGTLTTTPCIELAHTFHLGTRYTAPLSCAVTVPDTDPRHNAQETSPPDENGNSKIVQHSNVPVPLQMGCHGIGLSRLLATTSLLLSDSVGLNWPRLIAPFEVVIIAASGFEKESKRLYNVLTNQGIDTVVDDRFLDYRRRGIVWKMNDADVVGYPIVLLVTGRSWEQGRGVEVQCRRRGVKRVVSTEDGAAESVEGVVGGLLDGL